MLPLEIKWTNPQQHLKDVAKTLEKLDKALKADGLFDRLKQLQAYTPPSRKKRLKHEKAMIQRKRDQKDATTWNNKSTLHNRSK